MSAVADDERLHDAVAADNVRRLLAGTLKDPMPGTLAAQVDKFGRLIADATIRLIVGESP